jgi:seryl-tRNA synthetase
MTLDVTTFIAEKEGDPEAIRVSQKKRGNSVELVDEVITLYKEWVKSKFQLQSLSYTEITSVDFELNGLSKKINTIQKEIGAKKKVITLKGFLGTPVTGIE